MGAYIDRLNSSRACDLIVGQNQLDWQLHRVICVSEQRYLYNTHCVKTARNRTIAHLQIPDVYRHNT